MSNPVERRQTAINLILNYPRVSFIISQLYYNNDTDLVLRRWSLALYLYLLRHLNDLLFYFRPLLHKSSLWPAGWLNLSVFRLIIQCNTRAKDCFTRDQQQLWNANAFSSSPACWPKGGVQKCNKTQKHSLFFFENINKNSTKSEHAPSTRINALIGCMLHRARLQLRNAH